MSNMEKRTFQQIKLYMILCQKSMTFWLKSTIFNKYPWFVLQEDDENHNFARITNIVSILKIVTLRKTKVQLLNKSNRPLEGQKSYRTRLSSAHPYIIAGTTTKYCIIKSTPFSLEKNGNYFIWLEFSVFQWFDERCLNSSDDAVQQRPFPSVLSSTCFLVTPKRENS